MLTGKEEISSTTNKSGKGNAESEDLPNYLKGKHSFTCNLVEHCNKGGKKVFPQFAYGNSYEAPSYFKLKNSIICRESYDNPYLKYNGPPSTKLETLKGSTLNNFEFYNISEQRFVNKNPISFKSNKIFDTITNQEKIIKKPIEYKNDNTISFEQAYKSLRLFNKQKELFTDFIEKNDALNVYGPLNLRTRPTEFRDVKNYKLSPEQLKNKKKLQSRYLTPTNRSQIGQEKSHKLVRLPTIMKCESDCEKYFNKDQNFLNKITNQIIIEKIDEDLKKSFIKNKQKYKFKEENNEMESIIEVFEKHLEFEKQYKS